MKMVSMEILVEENGRLQKAQSFMVLESSIILFTS